MKNTLKISTPVGDFTRVTATAYTHAVVWNSPRAMEAYTSANGETRRWGGVHGRWIKDRGYGVTWHGSEGAARKAAAGKYMWDGSRDLLGVFPVSA